MEKVKQVIVFRKDLNVRKGKFASQVAHASLAVILNMMQKFKHEQDQSVWNRFFKKVAKLFWCYSLEFEENSYLDQWLNGKFTKITVSCKDEQELLDLYNQAKDAGIPCVLITDAGLTEFNGVPTNTCIAIGPFWNEEIDKITKHLPLL